ncbi:MAG: polymer-forming cytoskeletal protein [Oscillospiraceae bacterium]
MGIKDNFSQAVKELWKKDGLEENGNEKGGQPTELDKYLSGQNAATEQPAPVQPAAPVQQPTAQAQTVKPEQPMQQAAPAQPAPVQPDANSYQFGGEANSAGVPLETPYYRSQPAPEPQNAAPAPDVNAAQRMAGAGNGAYGGGYGGNGFGGNGGNGGYVPPTAPGNSINAPSDTDEVTVISRNTVIDGNVRSLANMQVDGNIKGNVETTRDVEMSGKIVGDIKCNNANMNSAAMQGNMNLKGKLRMDRDTILIGDLTSQYADVNGRIRGKLEIGGKAELKRDAIVFGDINASTIAVTDGAIIQGYVNTTFLSKEDSRSVFPEAISFDSKTGGEKP